MDANINDRPGERPLLMLPGLMCDATMFAETSRHVPGACTAADYGDCDALSAMAARVLEAAPEVFDLLGHSMGARVALEVIRQAPERVAGLALVSTGIHPPRPDEAEKRYALRDLGRAQGMAALVDAWLPPMVGQDAHADPALMERLRTMCIACGQDRFEAQIAALLARPAVDALLPAIDCPVLVACGDADRWSPPAQHHVIAAAIPHARLVVVEKAGHMLPVEAPASFAEMLCAWRDARRPIQ